METSVKQAVKEAVAKSPLSMKEAARIANIPYTSFIRYAQELGVYHPNPQHKGVPRYGRQSVKCIPLAEILDGKHPHYNTKVETKIVSNRD